MITSARRTFFVFFLVAIGLVPAVTQAQVVESGDFIDYIEDARDLTFAKNSNSYANPNLGNLSDFELAAQQLILGNIAQANNLAAIVNYEVVQYTDTVTNNVYHGLREQNNTPTRGWGSYFVNLAATREVLIEVPHPRFDTNSWDIGARIFRDSGARGFLMAGAHRNANGIGTADVAHLNDSIFQEAHKAWVGNVGQRVTYSIHGFDDDNHSFPAGTDVVISNGDGGVSSTIQHLDTQLGNVGFSSFAFNNLADNDPLNVAVNGNESGQTFSSLGGTTNQQGIYTRNLGGEFVHVEFEQSVRFDANNRILATNAVTNTILAVPEPSNILILLGIATTLIVGRRSKIRR